MISWFVNGKNTGVWPSGKATVFGIVIRRFESYHPSHFFFIVEISTVIVLILHSFLFQPCSIIESVRNLNRQLDISHK